MRYVRTHRGEKSNCCSYCNRYINKSHYLTMNVVSSLIMSIGLMKCIIKYIDVKDVNVLNMIRNVVILVEISFIENNLTLT